jgi:hypothetical protein
MIRVAVTSLFVATLFLWGCPSDGGKDPILSATDLRSSADLLLDGTGIDGEATSDGESSGDIGTVTDELEQDGAGGADLPFDLGTTDIPDWQGTLDASDLICQPQCDGKECGPDGCGGQCGNCPEVAPACDSEGMCQFECTPDCGDKECGSDGCSGDCGECEAGECVDGLCSELCPAADCDLVGERQCADESSYQVCASLEPPCEGILFYGKSKACLEGTLCVEGECLATNLCDLAAQKGSHFGCSFWSVDLALYPDPYSEVQPDTAPHALYFAAPPGETVNLQLSTMAQGIELEVMETSVCGGCSAALTMPVMSLGGAGIFDRSLHIASDRPISVVQVNPLDTAAAANDASLLWPEHLLDTNYSVLSWPTEPLEQVPIIGLPSQHGYFTVVATVPGTTDVSFTLPVTGKALTDGGELLEPGVLHTVTLAEHEVLQVLADGSLKGGSYDLSGATVAASQAVALFTGHEEAAVCYAGPEDDCCADHIEAQLLPDPNWGHHFMCVKAPPRGPADKDVWRVIAGNGGATLTTSPPISGLNKVKLEPGGWVEVATAKSFELVASMPVQVGQYLVGKKCAGAELGDPALIMMVPKKGFATEFYAPILPGYSLSQLALVRPVGTELSVAGIAVTEEFEPLGEGTIEYAYLPLQEGSWITIPEGGMAYLYGYSEFAAFGIPLGAELGE